MLEVLGIPIHIISEGSGPFIFAGSIHIPLKFTSENKQ